jgi:alpha-mannosidase
MALLSDSGKGMVLNCPTSPGISIDNPGLFRFSGTKRLTAGKVFVNLFNNQWGTNFTEWIEGSFSQKMYIWSFDRYNAEKSFITPSEETRSPLKGVFLNGPEGEIPVTQEGISLNRKGILVTAFKPDLNREGMVLRIWEQAGNGGLCKVTLPKESSYSIAYPCNLREEITRDEGIAISNNSLQFIIKANQPASFILK